MYNLSKAAAFINRDLRQARRFLEFEDTLGFIHLYILEVYGQIVPQISTHDMGEVKKLIRASVPPFSTQEYTADVNAHETEEILDSECEEILQYVESLYINTSVKQVYHELQPSVSMTYFNVLLIDCFGRKGKVNTWGGRFLLNSEQATNLPRYARHRALTVGVSIHTLTKYNIAV